MEPEAAGRRSPITMKKSIPFLLATVGASAVLGIASAPAGYYGQPPVYQQQPQPTLGYSTGAKTGPYFTFHGGGQWMNDISTMGVDVEFDAGWGVFGALGYRFNQAFALEAEAGYARVNIDDVSVGDTSFPVSGDVSQIPIMANAILHVPIGESFGFYFSGGGGTIRTNTSASSLANLPVDLDASGWNLALQAKAGVTFNVSQNLSLNLGYRFLMANDAFINDENTYGNFLEGGFTFRF